MNQLGVALCGKGLRFGKRERRQNAAVNIDDTHFITQTFAITGKSADTIHGVLSGLTRIK